MPTGNIGLSAKQGLGLSSKKKNTQSWSVWFECEILVMISHIWKTWSMTGGATWESCKPLGGRVSLRNWIPEDKDLRFNSLCPSTSYTLFAPNVLMESDQSASSSCCFFALPPMVKCTHSWELWAQRNLLSPRLLFSRYFNTVRRKTKKTY